APVTRNLRWKKYQPTREQPKATLCRPGERGRSKEQHRPPAGSSSEGAPGKADPRSSIGIGSCQEGGRARQKTTSYSGGSGKTRKRQTCYSR
ncbi:hypothetical protein PIB30_104638, partial [Stylosanthes scabra]|nr:hypothetical protein [Stylosanthes scabra]